VIPQFKKYYQTFQQKGKNKHQLNFDSQLNVTLKEINGYLCTATLTPLEDTKSHNILRCPLCSSVYHKNQTKNVCQTCLLCTLGEETLGLNNLIEE
jgi:hypothetical protein